MLLRKNKETRPIHTIKQVQRFPVLNTKKEPIFSPVFDADGKRTYMMFSFSVIVSKLRENILCFSFLNI